MFHVKHSRNLYQIQIGLSKINMKIKDHFLSKEIFEIKETEIEGIFKTYPIPENLGKY